MAFAIIIALLVIGSVIFHAWSPGGSPNRLELGLHRYNDRYHCLGDRFAFVVINLFLAYTSTNTGTPRNVGPSMSPKTKNWRSGLQPSHRLVLLPCLPRGCLFGLTL